MARLIRKVTGPSLASELALANLSDGVGWDGSTVTVMSSVSPRNQLALEALFEAHDPSAPAPPSPEEVKRDSIVADLETELARGTLDPTEARRAMLRVRNYVAGEEED